eukprot:gb/GEZJ01008541.1/.p1 GENE.gb/GEZJ01008541.1/~~gb/GEZJ01008541.1/.p1  ORF type:complete len:124 (-),score=6.61 gb/GEZJ01008541.1/:93-464(-)
MQYIGYGLSASELAEQCHSLSKIGLFKTKDNHQRCDICVRRLGKCLHKGVQKFHFKPIRIAGSLHLCSSKTLPNPKLTAWIGTRFAQIQVSKTGSPYTLLPSNTPVSITLCGNSSRHHHESKP